MSINFNLVTAVTTIAVLIISFYPAISRKRGIDKAGIKTLVERSLGKQGLGDLDRTKKYEINHQKRTIIIKERNP